MRRVHRFFATEKLTPAPFLAPAPPPRALWRVGGCGGGVRRRAPPRADGAGACGMSVFEPMPPPKVATAAPFALAPPAFGGAKSGFVSDELILSVSRALPGRASDASELRDGARDDRFCEARGRGWVRFVVREMRVDAGRILGGWREAAPAGG